MSTNDDDKSHIAELHSMPKRGFDTRGRKLTFSEQCAIAWALKVRTFKTATIRAAFNLTPATISWLRNSLEPDRIHYRNVREEYVRLGPERFEEKYYTRDLHFRFKRIELGLEHLDENKTDRAPRPTGPNPNATKYAGVHTLEDGSQWEVFWSDNPLGWWFSRPEKNARLFGREAITGKEDYEPFMRSEDAFDGLHEFNGYESPRPKPGRPKQTE